jgi:LmbE family N-acetylglucosaminyl deacetylase
MPNSLRLSSSDRILFFAPHPDDESLAGGGLIQKAIAAGAEVCLVFLTNGDRNPWPQRVMERSIFLDAKTRRRWGVRRQSEALAALAVLGLAADAEAHFLGWPDQGVTKLLMTADEAAMATICDFIRGWKPTLVFTPAAEDTHPDHSSFFVLLQIALDRLRATGFDAGESLSYLVHTPKARLAREIRALRLTAHEKAVKADAIQAHETQMLSRKRFVAHARDVEEFHLPFVPQAKHTHHPVTAGEIVNGALQLRVKLPGPLLSFRGALLHVVLETMLEGSLRWSLHLPGKSAKARVIDARTGKPLRWATVRISGRAAVVAIPVMSAVPLTRIFVKFDRRPLFFDLAGWREIAVDESRRPKLHYHRFSAGRPHRAD